MNQYSFKLPVAKLTPEEIEALSRKVGTFPQMGEGIMPVFILLI